MEKFLFCLNLRTGVIIISMFDLFLTPAHFMGISNNLKKITNLNNMDNDWKIPAIDMTFTGFLLCYFLILGIVCNVLLYKGVIQEDSKKLLTWIIYSIAYKTLNCLLLFVGYNISDLYGEQSNLAQTFRIFDIFFGIYAIICVVKFKKSLKEKDKAIQIEQPYAELNINANTNSGYYETPESIENILQSRQLAESGYTEMNSIDQSTVQNETN